MIAELEDVNGNIKIVEKVLSINIHDELDTSFQAEQNDDVVI